MSFSRLIHTVTRSFFNLQCRVGGRVHNSVVFCGSLNLKLCLLRDFAERSTQGTVRAGAGTEIFSLLSSGEKATRKAGETTRLEGGVGFPSVHSLIDGHWLPMQHKGLSCSCVSLGTRPQGACLIHSLVWHLGSKLRCA